MSARLPSNKIKNYKHGVWAEYLAAAYLLCRGYRILALRYKTKVGEIDIVARRGRTIVFIEVKYRQNMDDALAAVRPSSQARIRRAAEYYFLAKQHESSTLNPNIRFDVIAIIGPLLIKHIKNAF